MTEDSLSVRASRRAPRRASTVAGAHTGGRRAASGAATAREPAPGARAETTDAQVVVFDIDATLADVSERLHHLQSRPRDWDGFVGTMAQDKAIRAIVRLCNLLHDGGVRVMLCSGRPEAYRRTTVEWLGREGVRYQELRLRRDRDRRSDTLSPSRNEKATAMTTRLEGPLKREISIDDAPYTLTITPEGMTLVPKGRRKGVTLEWKALASGDAALAVALNASLQPAGARHDAKRGAT
jgi:hypothetical protein